MKGWKRQGALQDRLAAMRLGKRRMILEFSDRLINTYHGSVVTLRLRNVNLVAFNEKSLGTVHIQSRSRLPRTPSSAYRTSALPAHNVLCSSLASSD